MQIWYEHSFCVLRTVLPQRNWIEILGRGTWHSTTFPTTLVSHLFIDDRPNLKSIRSKIQIDCFSSFFLHVHRDMQLQLIDTTLKITPGSFPQSEYLTVCIIRITSSRQGVLFLKDVLRSLTPRLNVYIHAKSSELVLCAPEFWCLDGLGIGGWKLAPIPNGI